MGESLDERAKRRTPFALASAISLLTVGMLSFWAHAMFAANINVAAMPGDQSECAAAVNPSNSLQIYVVCNNDAQGLFAALSSDGGTTWAYADPAKKTIANGDRDRGPTACCDPTVAWDRFGNLYVGYVNQNRSKVIVIRSADGGVHFKPIASFGSAPVDRPVLVAADTSVTGVPVVLWLLWSDNEKMVARGAPVNTLGSVGGFTSRLILPGTDYCASAGLAVSRDGAVAVVCQIAGITPQGPSTLKFSLKADGLGSGKFSKATVVTTTNVGIFYPIKPQAIRTIDATPGLAYDRVSPSHVGRLYLVYSDRVPNVKDDTNVMAMWSDDNGTTWNGPTRVNDDVGTTSQFFPTVATNSQSGDLVICWLDARNSPSDTAIQEFCAFANSSAFPSFASSNVQIAHGYSTSPGGLEFGDYEGLGYFAGVAAYPVWPDSSNSTGDNPDKTRHVDPYTERVVAPTLATATAPVSARYFFALALGFQSRSGRHVCDP